MLGNGNIVQGREGGRKQKKETPIPQTDNGRKKEEYKKNEESDRERGRETSRFEAGEEEKREKLAGSGNCLGRARSCGISLLHILCLSVFLSLIILFCFLFF